MSRLPVLPASAAAALLLATVVGCGGSSPAARANEAAGALWQANAGQLIDQLRDDVVVATSFGGSPLDAHRALSSDGDMVALLAAYDDFGACRGMLRDAGTVVTRYAPVARLVGAACTKLERAAVLFNRAATRHDPAALVAATAAARATSVLITRAKYELGRRSLHG